MDKFKSPMLASDYKPELLKFPLLASPKIDGIRCVIDKTAEYMYDPYSRSGKIIRNKFIQQQIGLTPFYGLDGELVVGEASAPDVYNRTSSGVMAEKGEPDFIFWVFDHRNVEGDFAQRSVEAHRIVMQAAQKRVRWLPQEWIRGPEELEAFEAKCLELGFEGIMIRDPDSMYKFGRSTAKGGELLKVKRTAHDEFEIVDFVEMMSNQNEATTNELGRTKRSTAQDGLVPADTLGAFVGRNRAKWDVDFNVSPGILTAAERKELWDNREAHRGRTGVMKHLPHGAKDRPRHGRFNGFRDPSDLS
jgi:DNA ligase-1